MNLEDLTAYKVVETRLSLSPRHYQGTVSYQKDSRFTPISHKNALSYDIIGTEGGYVYTAHPERSMGFVFTEADFIAKKDPMVPVLNLKLRDSNVKGYKQAYRLRLRKEHARANVAFTWYTLYVNAVGGIVSDFEHMEGGRLLWESLIRKAESNKMRASLVNVDTGESQPVDGSTPHDQIWSADNSKLRCAIVLERSDQGCA